MKKLLRNIDYVGRKVIRELWRPFLRFYNIYIVKDNFTLQMRRWIKDGGDKNLRFDYPSLNENSIVFDLGGYLGDFASEISQKYNCQVYVFEPHPEYFSHCVDRFSGRSNIKVFNYGLSNADGEFQLSDKGDGSSFENPNHSNGIGVKCLVKDILVVLDDLCISQIDLMKMNIEGGEFPLLDHLIKNEKQNIVDQYQIQFHSFIENAVQRRNRIIETMSSTHKRSWCYEFVWENWKRK